MVTYLVKRLSGKIKQVLTKNGESYTHEERDTASATGIQQFCTKSGTATDEIRLTQTVM
jgi:hypothetical protein